MFTYAARAGLLVLVLTACATPPSGSVAPSLLATGVGAEALESAAEAAEAGNPSLTPSASVTPSSAAIATPPAPSPPAACVPTDQDQYVYHPTRLVVLAACIRVTGTIAVIRTEADGDRHILVALDPQFQYLLTPANNGIELGDLVVEPVCVGTTTQSDAIATCAADKDPLTVLPAVGQHVWLEGRYVTDSSHGGWSELHPLYRWGASLGVSEGE